MPPPVRVHLAELTGRFGIYQHARGHSPDPGHGYCTDDVARAAIVDVLHGRELGFEAIAPSLEVSLAYLSAAFVAQTGRLRNFRDDDGNWLEHQGSADAHARTVQALGWIVGEPGLDRSTQQAAGQLMELTLPAALDLDGLRPWAHVIIGCVTALDGSRPPAGAQPVLEELAGRLAARFEIRNDRWPWPEAQVTYENALLAQALIVGGVRLGDGAMVRRGLAALAWLLDRQVDPAGHVVLVGNRGWWPRDGEPAHYDQQPIDADSLVEACASAWRAGGEPEWLIEMERSYAWFTGWNSVGIAVADPVRGACGDGLTAVGVNANEGAESTLAWLAATECVRSTRYLASLERAS